MKNNPYLFQLFNHKVAQTRIGPHISKANSKIQSLRRERDSRQISALCKLDLELISTLDSGSRVRP
jgi:hypothetical protein